MNNVIHYSIIMFQDDTNIPLIVHGLFPVPDGSLDPQVHAGMSFHKPSRNFSSTSEDQPIICQQISARGFRQSVYMYKLVYLASNFGISISNLNYNV